MKIRQGFVSNSSSSSFIVAFKGRKPKSYEALRKLMFPELKDEDHLTVYDNTFQVTEVVGQVLRDLPIRTVSMKTLVEEFSGGWRYHYDTHGWDRIARFGGEGEKYFGSDKEALEQLRVLCQEDAAREVLYWENYHRRSKELTLVVAAKLGYPQPKYSEDKEGYEVFDKLVNKLKDKDVEWKKILLSSPWRSKDQKKINSLVKKCATADAKAFKEDMKGHFIGTFSYADEDGSFGSLMEHGGVFDNLTHIRFSHH